MDGQRWHSGSGDYVRPQQAGEPDAWTTEMAQQGKTGSQRLLEVAEVSPPANVREALNLGPGQQAVVRRRLVLTDGVAVELTDSYYPSSIARGTVLADFRKIRGGAVTALAELGHVPRFVSETVHSRTATPEERDLLALADNQAVLVLFRVTMDEERRPIEVSLMVITDGRHLHYELAT